MLQKTSRPLDEVSPISDEEEEEGVLGGAETPGATVRQSRAAAPVGVGAPSAAPPRPLGHP